MASVTLTHINKIYPNGAKAVDDFCLDIKDKEFIVFVGPSGCGKSTTLRMIAGLEYITEGELKIGDRVVNSVEPKNRDIAMVFQNYALYPHMTVFDNMAFGLTLAKTPVEVRDESTIILKGKDGNKLNPFVLFFAKRFARTPLEQRDENGNIIYGEDGKPKFVARKNYGARTPLEERDENGEIVKDSNGNPVYVVKKNKDGTPVIDENGNPVYKMRKYTEEEILAGKLPDLLDKDGNVIYETRPYHIDEYAGKPVVDENGKIKYVAKTNKDGSTVLDKNGEVVYKLRKWTKPEIKEKVEAAARTLDITEYLERKPKQLSGGQRQRVAIGRSIVRSPKVFLMDEPLSNLDAKLRNQMRAEIILLRKKINTTFVYVTHDQVEAMTLGDRIVIMKDGVVQQVGTPTEVFNHPANLFVAGFIGTPQMNYFDAKLVKDTTGYCVELDGKKFLLDEKVVAYLKEQNCEEKDITLGVRPEHIVVKLSGNENVIATMGKHLGADGKMSFIKTTVTVSEMMGSESYVHVATENEKAIILRVPTINLSKEDIEKINNGGDLDITFSPQAMHIFDKETGKNIVPLSVVSE